MNEASIANQAVFWYNGTEPNMLIVTPENKISLSELREMSKRMFGNLVKAVVDTEKEVMAIDGELHADEQALLLEQGSKQQNIWGINLYSDKTGDDFVEFDSLINIRPLQKNRSRGVENEEIRKKILEIVNNLIKK